jgi:hypothetical protein
MLDQILQQVQFRDFELTGYFVPDREHVPGQPDQTLVV